MGRSEVYYQIPFALSLSKVVPFFSEMEGIKTAVRQGQDKRGWVEIIAPYYHSRGGLLLAPVVCGNRC